jgi:hypothetical protein
VWTKRHTSSSDSDDAGRGNRCFDGGVLSVQRAADLAVELDLDVEQTGICFACLGIVASALDYGNERDIRSCTLRMTPDLWEDGLASPAAARTRAGAPARREGCGSRHRRRRSERRENDDRASDRAAARASALGSGARSTQLALHVQCMSVLKRRLQNLLGDARYRRVAAEAETVEELKAELRGRGA